MDPKEPPCDACSINFDNVNLVKVCDMFCEHLKTWNRHLITESFPKEIQCRTLSIPIPPNICKDSWAWCADPKGMFSVRSCCREQMRRVWQNTNLVASATIDVEQSFWKKLWKLHILPSFPFCKLNTDATTNIDTGGFGGGVIRDHKGICIGALLNLLCTTQRSLFLSPLQ